MADMLKQMQEDYVPRYEEKILKPIIMQGDQLTEEQARQFPVDF